MKTLSFLIILGLAFPLAFSGQFYDYRISGELHVPKASGIIYLYLVDYHHFEIPNSGLDTLELEVNSAILDYELLGIPPGKYALRCIQDLNGNKKLDKGLFGPTEPWALSWKGKQRFPPKFEDLSFDLISDTTIVLKLEK